METKYYKAKNNFSFLGFLLVLLVTFILGSLISIPYLFLTQKIPFVYINIIMPIFTGVLIGVIAGKVAKSTKFVSPVWGSISITLAFIGFTIIKWAIYIYNLFKEDIPYGLFEGVTQILSTPSDAWQIICSINEYGTWSLNSSKSNVTGILLWLVWLAEIAIMFIMLWIGYYSCIDIPFIDTDNDWAICTKGKLTLQDFDLKAEKTSIEKNPLLLLDCPILPHTNSKVNFVSLDLYSSSDGNLNYISVTRYVLNNKEQYDEEKLIKYLCVDSTFMEKLESPADRLFV